MFQIYLQKSIVSYIIKLNNLYNFYIVIDALQHYSYKKHNIIFLIK